MAAVRGKLYRYHRFGHYAPVVNPPAYWPHDWVSTYRFRDSTDFEGEDRTGTQEGLVPLLVASLVQWGYCGLGTELTVPLTCVSLALQPLAENRAIGEWEFQLDCTIPGFEFVMPGYAAAGVNTDGRYANTFPEWVEVIWVPPNPFAALFALALDEFRWAGEALLRP